MTPLLVVLGAAAGAPLRLLAIRIAGPLPERATLAVNVMGSAILGVLLGLGDVPAAVTTLVGTGFCGALTTFSAVGADVVRLIEERTLGRAVGHLLATLVLGLGAAAAGYALAAG